MGKTGFQTGLKTGFLRSSTLFSFLSFSFTFFGHFLSSLQPINMVAQDLFTHRLVAYLRRNAHNASSMETFEELSLDGDMHTGCIQLKWWKVQGQLIIQGISIEPQGDNLLTASVKSLIRRPEAVDLGLREVVLQCVPHSALLERLVQRGWMHHPHDPYSLRMFVVF